MRVINVLILFLTLTVTTTCFSQMSLDNVVTEKIYNTEKNVELTVLGTGEIEINIKEDNTPFIEIFVNVYQTDFDVAIVNSKGEENGGEIRVYGQKFNVKWQQVYSDSDRGTYNMDVITTIRDKDDNIVSREKETVKFTLK